MAEQIAAGAIGDVVLIVPAGVIVAVVWLVVEWLKRRKPVSPS